MQTNQISNSFNTSLSLISELLSELTTPAISYPTAKGFGCIAVQAKTVEEIKEAFTTALGAEGPTVLAIPIARQPRPLVPSD
jgi:thiamine pyrophosphate-dependent acetolactate synthase large subunit-like protein